ncbi:hypothetical protein ACIHFD_64255 [Nonomuraea sp. NPDC051941]|uniref:hypothetical protein n=1 Tax=Nonomuraea sp. NPDC051941 TaxID=3364373 RepID=UPI0037C59101
MPSFEHYARHNYATRLGASPTQRATYLAEAERHVFPRFGHLPLDQVTRRVLREWVEWMLTKPSTSNQHQPRRQPALPLAKAANAGSLAGKPL